MNFAKPSLKSTNQVPVRLNGGSGRSLSRFLGAEQPRVSGCCGIRRLSGSRRSSAVCEKAATGAATAAINANVVSLLILFPSTLRPACIPPVPASLYHRLRFATAPRPDSGAARWPLCTARSLRRPRREGRARRRNPLLQRVVEPQRPELARVQQPLARLLAQRNVRGGEA